MKQKIIIVDLGSQFTQLIARRIREFNVYCEIYPYMSLPKFDQSVKGVILSGSSLSVDDAHAPRIDLSNIKGRLPLLGIGYGAQLMVSGAGGKVVSGKDKGFAGEAVEVEDRKDVLFGSIGEKTQVWMSHSDVIRELPKEFTAIAKDTAGHVAAYKIDGEQSWGMLFHPEVSKSADGGQMLENFVIGVCGCERSWTPASFAKDMVESLKKELGNDKVLLALSGGVDSTVSAVLLHRAIGANLTCIFVNHGLLRKNEFTDVQESYKHMGLNVIGVDASAKFLGELKGVIDPEKKRKIIGHGFIDVFDREAQKLKDIKWLAQGTIYPDVVESFAADGSLAVKSHHNVGGLPEKMNLRIVEPLRLLFKDEVRRVGAELGIASTLLGRHPFPGPGLGIRVLGEVTAEKIAILQNADKIYTDTLREYGLYDKVWQAAAILLPVQSVGVTGDQRTYEFSLALRAVNSVDGMTADWVELPYSFLGDVSNRIIKGVEGVNRVVYDISSKPPATIEWE